MKFYSFFLAFFTCISRLLVNLIQMIQCARRVDVRVLRERIRVLELFADVLGAVRVADEHVLGFYRLLRPVDAVFFVHEQSVRANEAILS